MRQRSRCADLRTSSRPSSRQGWRRSRPLRPSERGSDLILAWLAKAAQKPFIFGNTGVTEAATYERIKRFETRASTFQKPNTSMRRPSQRVRQSARRPPPGNEPSSGPTIRRASDSCLGIWETQGEWAACRRPGWSREHRQPLQQVQPQSVPDGMDGLNVAGCKASYLISNAETSRDSWTTHIESDGTPGPVAVSFRTTWRWAKSPKKWPTSRSGRRGLCRQPTLRQTVARSSTV